MKKTAANVAKWEYVRELDALALRVVNAQAILNRLVEEVGVGEAYRMAILELEQRYCQHPRGNSAVRVDGA